MFAEAIPGVIIQLLAILVDANASTAAIASLSISAFTTGFTSASISFDWDVHPQKRIENPDFFGYIPNDAKKRTGKKRNKQNLNEKPCASYNSQVSIDAHSNFYSIDEHQRTNATHESFSYCFICFDINQCCCSLHYCRALFILVLQDHSW